MTEPGIREFLLARIAEDEADVEATRTNELHVSGPVEAEDALERLARPDRLAAECEAKRRIVGLHTAGPNGTCETCYIYAEGVADNPTACPTARALASVDADHPDFDPAWRVS